MSEMPKIRHSETGLAAIRIEADGLVQLAQAFTGEAATAFDAAVNAILATSGRTIVTGIGKSGHIARKAAATLSSTGTPALYIHPAEASHGDLGAITGNDIIIFLSNSGESAELAPIIGYSKLFSVQTIAVTSRPESTLGRQANIVLCIPAALEACPNGLAPTTSTLLQLAICDALAVALLKARNFKPADFSVYHPAGQLGAMIRTVETLMHRGAGMPVVPPGLKMREAIPEMTEKAMGLLVITEADGRIGGVITDGDLRRHMTDPDILERTTGEIMTRNPRTIGGDRLLAEAAQIFGSHRISSLFVVDGDQRLTGILRLADLVQKGII